ncbi:TPA: hypothetical protein RZK51_001576 [Campylobacter coli]|nr:hypothetical protein [Campylobacter coli]
MLQKTYKTKDCENYATLLKLYPKYKNLYVDTFEKREKIKIYKKNSHYSNKKKLLKKENGYFIANIKYKTLKTTQAKRDINIQEKFIIFITNKKEDLWKMLLL